MVRQGNQVRWDQWRQRVDRQRASGLSIAEFCRRERLSPHGFYVWRRRIQGASSSRAKASTTRRLRERPRDGASRRRSRPSPADRFGSVRPSGFLQLPVAAMRPGPWIELALADGTIVRLPHQDVAGLIAVLRVLRGESFDLPHAEHGHA